jgi:hypothetical protein
MDTFLMELMRGGAISLKMFLENTTLPFKDRLLQAVVAEEERMQQAQAAQMGGGELPPAANGAGGGIPAELMQQVEQGVDPAAMEALQRGMGG